MRANAEISQAILAAIAQGPCTLRDAAERSQVGYKTARATIGNLIRAKKLQKCSKEKRAHAKCWCYLYEVVEPQVPEPTETPEAAGAKVLALSMAAWTR